MGQLEYRVPVLVRERVLPARSPQAKLRRDACREVGENRLGDLKSGFAAARYATFTWVVVALVSLVVWLAAVMIARYAFGLAGFDSLGAQVPIRCLFGIALASMAMAGFTMIKSPGVYMVQGKATYMARRFGPHPMDFWIAIVVGVIAALAL
jgi:hypothetical protein